MDPCAVVVVGVVCVFYFNFESFVPRRIIRNDRKPAIKQKIDVYTLHRESEELAADDVWVCVFFSQPLRVRQRWAFW